MKADPIPNVETHAPTHAKIDQEGRLVCWYGQDPCYRPTGPGVLIHCIMPTPNRLRVFFREYAVRDQEECLKTGGVAMDT
jgi:hypothetical protein